MYDPHENKLLHSLSLPVEKFNAGRKNWTEIDDIKLEAALTNAICEYGVTLIVIEAVHASPQMGVSSAFTFGEGFGTIKTIARSLMASKDQVVFVTPNKWKARMGLSVYGKEADKHASVQMARKLFGESPWFKRISYDGVAEAALIAKYGAMDLVQQEEDPLS